MFSEQRRMLGGIDHRLLVIFMIFILSSVAYGTIFTHPFIDYDDRAVITDRIDTYDGINTENITNIILQDFPREEPLILRDLSYLVNAELFGPLNPFGYLLGNFLLHLVVCYLVYLLCLKLFPGRYYLAILSTILFCLHPIHAESVAWISSRKESLSAVFYLLAVIQYMSSLKAYKKSHLVLSLLFFLCALLSKIGAISFLITIVFYRAIVEREKPVTFVESCYGIIVILTTLAYTKWYTGVLNAWGVLNKNIVTFNRDWIAWFLSNCEYFTFYWLKFLFPLEQSTYYDFPAAPLIYSDMSYLVFSLIFIALYCLTIFFLLKKRQSSLAFIFTFCICTLLPYMGLTQIRIYVADRYAYLASIGFCIIAAYSIFAIHDKLPFIKRFKDHFLVIFIVCVSTFLCLKTVNATGNWSSTVAFWQNAIKIAPNTPATYSGLMKHYKIMYKYLEDRNAANGYLLLAESVGENGIKRLCPNLNNCATTISDLTDSMASVKWSLNKSEEAEYYFKATLFAAPNYFQSRYEYSLFLIQEKRYAEALIQIELIENIGIPYSYNGMLKEIKEKLRPMAEAGLAQTTKQKFEQ